METKERHQLTVDEIHLLRTIARWRRATGVSYFQWRPGKGFGVMTEWKMWHGDVRKRRQINVTYEPDTESGPASLAATRDYYGSEDFKDLSVTTVAEAVDVLVALGFLPPRFSSAYRAGWDAAIRADQAAVYGPVAI